MGIRIHTRRERPLLHALAGLAVLAPGPLAALDVRHAPVACVVAEAFPEISASFPETSGVGLARAVVRFRAASSDEWYGVAMVPRGALMVGTLPRPLTTLEGIEYYVEAFRTDGRALRTPIFRPRVVASTGACPGVAAPSAGAAASVLLPPPGAPPFPPGFRSGAERPRAAPAPLAPSGGAPPGVVGTGSEAGSSGFPVRWLIGAVAAGGAVGALAARNRGGAADAAPRGDASSPEGIAGSWLAQMSGVRRVGDADCRLTATLVLDFQDPVGGELAGSAVATVLILEPAGCSHAVAVGQTGALVGKIQGDDLSFSVEGPPGKPPYAFDGTLRGDSLEGTVSQGEVDDEGLLSGSWTAARR